MEGSRAQMLLTITFMVVAAVFAEQTSATSAPNSYSSCMANCPGYNCPQGRDASCLAYCAVACAIPPYNFIFANAKDHHASSSSSTQPNSYFSCLQDCPSYNCPDSVDPMDLEKCAIYCLRACAGFSATNEPAGIATVFA